MTEPAAGWHPDPSGRFELRYWDGTSWTQSVSSGGRQETDVALVQAPPPDDALATPGGQDATVSAPVADDPGASPGPGWWMASDGNWYPPEGDDATTESPSAVPPEPTAPVTMEESNAKPALSPKKLAIIGGAGVGALVIAVVLFLTFTGGGGGGSDDASGASKSSSASSKTDKDNSKSDAPRRTATIESGFTTTTPESVGVALDDLDDAVLVGIGYRLTIESAALVDAVDDFNPNASGSGRFSRPAGSNQEPTDLVPARGEQLLVVRYDLEMVNEYGSDVPSISVLVDDVKYSVELPTGPNTLIASVDADADDVGLAVQETEDSQSISVLTGELGDDYPEVLYRANRRIAVNDTATLPYTMVGPPNRYESLVCGGPGRLDVVLGNAELVWSQRDSALLADARLSGALTPPSDGSQAWLVVEINDYQAQSSNACGTDPQIPTERVVLVLADDTQVTAAVATTEYAIFAVPADLSQATFEMRPGDNVLDAKRDGHVFNFGPSVAQMSIVFSAATGSPSSDSSTDSSVGGGG